LRPDLISSWRAEGRRFGRYLIAGCLNAVVSLSAIYICLKIGVSSISSNIFGFSVGLLISFSLSKIFVFESKRRTGPELRRFVASFAISFAANLATLESLSSIASSSPFLAQLIAISVYVTMMFSLGRWVIFKAGVDDQLVNTKRNIR